MNSLKDSTLGSLIEFQRGYDLPKKNFINGPYPVRSSNGVLGYHNEYKSEGPGITIGRSGTVGLPHFIEEDFFPHNTTLFIRDFKGNDEKYIYYLVTSLKLNEWKSGSGVPTLNRNHLHPIKIKAYVENQDQKRIAKVLSDLDAKIELNYKINKELEAMAKAIYDYWFVQFDFPISKEQAETIGKPELEGKPYKSSGGKMVFNKELKREIPQGWREGSLMDIAEFVNGIACQKYRPEEGEESYRVIKIREMSDGFTDKSEFVSRDIPEKVVVRNGDVLFSWSATLDVKIWTGGIGGLNQHIFRVSSGEFPRTFYYFEVLRYLEYFKMVAELRKTTMGHITRTHLEQSRIAIPPLGLVEALHEKLNPIIEKKVIASEESQKLTELRDWLLPMLMNGQVTLRELEEEVSEAAEPGVEYEDRKEARILPFVSRVIPSEMQPVSEDSITTVHAALVSRILVTDKNLDTGERHLGRTLVEKTVHVIESHTKCDVGRMPYRKARGAVDFDRITQKVEPHAKKKKWFVSKKIDGKVIYSGGMNDFEGYRKSAVYFRNKIDEIDRIIDLFLPLNTHRGEVYQTTYAAWHDLIAMGYKPKNEDIVTHSSTKEFWHEEKEKIPKEEFFEAIEWLKENDLVPDGKGKMTVKR